MVRSCFFSCISILDNYLHIESNNLDSLKGWENRLCGSVHIYSLFLFASGFSETSSRCDKIFEKRITMFPVCYQEHWCLWSYLRFADATHCLLVLDSKRVSLLTKYNRFVKQSIVTWLREEWDRLREDDSVSFDEKGLATISPSQSPLQGNDNDCGVFMCRFMTALYMERGNLNSITDVRNLFSLPFFRGINQHSVTMSRQTFKTLSLRLVDMYGNVDLAMEGVVGETKESVANDVEERVSVATDVEFALPRDMPVNETAAAGALLARHFSSPARTFTATISDTGKVHDTALTVSFDNKFSSPILPVQAATAFTGFTESQAFDTVAAALFPNPFSSPVHPSSDATAATAGFAETQARDTSATAFTETPAKNKESCTAVDSVAEVQTRLSSSEIFEDHDTIAYHADADEGLESKTQSREEDTTENSPSDGLEKMISHKNVATDYSNGERCDVMLSHEQTESVGEVQTGQGERKYMFREEVVVPRPPNLDICTDGKIAPLLHGEKGRKVSSRPLFPSTSHRELPFCFSSLMNFVNKARKEYDELFGLNDGRNKQRDFYKTLETQKIVSVKRSYGAAICVAADVFLIVKNVMVTALTKNKAGQYIGTIEYRDKHKQLALKLGMPSKVSILAPVVRWLFKDEFVSAIHKRYKRGLFADIPVGDIDWKFHCTDTAIHQVDQHPIVRGIAYEAGMRMVLQRFEGEVFLVVRGNNQGEPTVQRIKWGVVSRPWIKLTEGIDYTRRVVVDEAWLKQIIGEPFLEWATGNFVSEAKRDWDNLNIELFPKEGEEVRSGTYTVDLHSELITYRVYTQQIWSVIYYPERDEWKGRTCLRLGWDENGCYDYNRVGEVDVSEQWMRDNFVESFVETVKEKCSCGTPRYFAVPPGACLTEEAKQWVQKTAEVLGNEPQVVYKQGDEPTCASSSLASALVNIGYKEEAKMVNERGISLLKSRDIVRVLPALIECLQGSQRFQREMRTIKISAMSVDEVLREGNKEDGSLLVFSIASSDGSCSHAVSVCGGWIFDSNLDCALLLNKRNLDLCSGECNEMTGEMPTMLSAVSAYKFIRRYDGRNEINHAASIKIKKKRKKKQQASKEKKRKKEGNTQDIRLFFPPIDFERKMQK
jgi:Ulp1 protease family, C-terminal catalytic domain